MIEISSIGYGLIFGATALAVLSYCKDRRLALLYQLACGLAALAGAVGMLLSRQRLLSALAYLEAERIGGLQAGFVDWCVDAFDRFALIGMVITFLGIFLSFYLLKYKPASIPEALRQPGRMVLMLQLLLLVLCVTYGLNTINKIFDVSSYISAFGFSAIGLLCIAYVMERRL